MQVEVRLGEPFWRLAETKQVLVEVVEGATVGDLLTALAEQIPALGEALQESDLPPTVFIDDLLVDRDDLLPEGARPTLVWAMAGG